MIFAHAMLIPQDSSMLPKKSITVGESHRNPNAANPAAGLPKGLACARSCRRRMVWFIVVLTSALLPAASGCNSKRALSVEGVWTDKDRPTARFVFHGDGTGRLTDDCSPPNLDIGSGTDFRWKMVGGQMQVSFKSAGRECLGKLENKVLVLGPADSLRFGDGHYLSNPHTLVWFAPTR